MLFFFFPALSEISCGSLALSKSSVPSAVTSWLGFRPARPLPRPRATLPIPRAVAPKAEPSPLPTALNALPVRSCVVPAARPDEVISSVSGTPALDWLRPDGRDLFAFRPGALFDARVWFRRDPREEAFLADMSFTLTGKPHKSHTPHAWQC